MYSATSVTFTPLAVSSFAVPPVERIATPSSASPRASSASPVLSETLISACLILILSMGVVRAEPDASAARGAAVLLPSPRARLRA